jgi:hypothetical protein
LKTSWVCCDVERSTVATRPFWQETGFLSGGSALRLGIGPDHDGVGDLEDLVGGHIDALSMAPDRLHVACLVDASKRDLFKVVFETGERRILELVAERAMAASSPFAALLESARAYLQLCETDEELRRIGLLQSRVVLGWEGWRAAATELGIGVALVAVSAAIEAGELAPHDPEMIEAATLIAVAADRRAARERSEAVVVDLLEGLRR